MKIWTNLRRDNFLRLCLSVEPFRCFCEKKQAINLNKKKKVKKRDRKKRKFSTRTLKQRKKKLWNLNLCADIWFWQFSFRKKERKKEKFNEKRKKNKKKSYKDRGLLCALLGFSIDVTNVKKKHPYRNFTLIFTRSRSLPEKGKKNYKNFSSYTTDDDFVRERQCWEKKRENLYSLRPQL